MLSALVLSAMFSAAPDGGTTTQYAYDFFLKDARVGVVVVELSGTTYRYGSVQVLNRDGRVDRRRRGDVLELSASMRWRGNIPATLALVTMSSEPGCADVVDEVTRKLGSYCVTEVADGTSRGTLLGKPVSVVIAKGVAEEISFPSDGSRFVRIPRYEEPLEDPPDLTADGFAVPGAGPLRVQPPVDTALPKMVTVKAAEARVWFDAVRAEDHVFCSEFARAFVQRAGEGRAAMVHGLRIEDGRAYPHAWVRVVTERGAVEYDPTFGVTSTGSTYLPLLYATDSRDSERVGQLWLSFVNGTRTVSRGRPR